MESNAQYALHDSESTQQAWAARVRLTPELLEKLRQAPEQVLLKLNVPVGDASAKSRGSSKKTSLMTVKFAADGETEETEEQYELLSFPEDPGINHVCTFRREAAEDAVGGYNIFKTGEIHQKLLVQRLLDATEKDRIKDKHAKSVLASKSRASKLIDSELEKPAKRQRLTRLSSVPISKKATGSAWSIASGSKRTRKLVLPSALTKEEAKEAKDRIEKGFEVEVEQLITPQLEGHIGDDEDDDREGEIAPVVVVSKETAAAARDAEFHALFPSDSDDEDTSASKKRVIRRVKKISAKEIKESQRVETEGADTETRVIRREKKKSAKEVKENQRVAAVVDEDSETAGATNKETSHSDLDDSAQPKESASAAEDGNVADASLPAKNDENTMQCKQNEETLDIYALKPIKPSASGVEVKRARVRSALVSDRVKQTRLPDLSFFPSAVVQICQRLPHYHGRSVILDESDYDSYVDTHEQFRQDWEILDKAYSIEMIKTEGLHLQLEMATPDTNQEELKARIKASSSKKEGLLFVRDAMTSIQKILHSIQVSVDRFDMRTSHTPTTQ